MASKATASAIGARAHRPLKTESRLPTLLTGQRPPRVTCPSLKRHCAFNLQFRVLPRLPRPQTRPPRPAPDGTYFSERCKSSVSDAELFWRYRTACAVPLQIESGSRWHWPSALHTHTHFRIPGGQPEFDCRLRAVTRQRGRAPGPIAAGNKSGRRESASRRSKFGFVSFY